MSGKQGFLSRIFSGKSNKESKCCCNCILEEAEPEEKRTDTDEKK